MVEACPSLRGNLLWHSAIECLRDAACNAGQRVGIPSERYGQAHRVLIILRSRNASDCFRRSFLTRLVEKIPGPNFRDSPLEVVTEFRVHSVANLRLRAFSCKEYCSCRRLCALDALRMIVRYFSASSCFREHFFKRLKRVRHRAHTHRRPIAPARYKAPYRRESPTTKSVHHNRAPDRHSHTCENLST